MSIKKIHLLPPFLILFFFLLSFTSRVQQSGTLYHTFLGLSCLLAVIYAITLFIIIKRNYIPETKTVIVKAHYVQMTLHLSIFAYWGWYWDQVYQQTILIIAQLVFIHILDILFRWLRNEPWLAGFGRFPIILSTNLFLWFRDDWFYLQFLMIAFGMLAKDFFTWERDGRRTHIFNPSAISLSVASTLLLLTSSTNISWGNEISNTLSYPPYIYIWIFSVGLIVQYLFHVTLVTVSTAITLLFLGAVYYHFSGVYFFFTSDIPIAVFLGLHLLVTDPVTSPKTNMGRILFGIFYALSVMILFEILEALGAPSFYDKLLAVPLLNLSVKLLDKFARQFDFTTLTKKIFGKLLNSYQLNLIHMTLWIVIFTTWYLSGHVGSSHPGRQSSFWENACDKNLRGGCKNLHDLISVECDRNNALACAKLGSYYRYARGVERDDHKAYELVNHACELGLQEARDHLDEYHPADMEKDESFMDTLKFFPWEK